MSVRAVVAFVLVLLVLYGGFKAAPLLIGPTLSLESPTEGQSLPDGTVHIKGIAHHTEKLTLDGAPLLIDKSGAFETSLDLPQGSAILSLTVTDRFGRTHSTTVDVYVPRY